MRLLVVTGAGASRRLGVDGNPMPLMPDWANGLCDALDARETALAAACHLERGMSGVEFESALGALIQWQQVRHLDERFQGLGGPQANHHYSEVITARENATSRLHGVMETLNATLFDLFGQSRVDDARARDAYGALLELLQPTSVAIATTNYDRAAETALEALGHRIDSGFRGTAGRTPTLDPRSIEGFGHTTPVLHLHGAVGWYERDGVVRDHFADQEYNPSLGVPVVLYPDPDKDPTKAAVVRDLWSTFSRLIQDAECILVVGHSLHDPALVRALRTADGQGKAVGVCHFDPADASGLTASLPFATSLRADFGPDAKLALDIEKKLQLGRLRARKG